jgi:hypothetical protein
MDSTPGGHAGIGPDVVGEHGEACGGTVATAAAEVLKAALKRPEKF